MCDTSRTYERSIAHQPISLRSRLVSKNLSQTLDTGWDFWFSNFRLGLERECALSVCVFRFKSLESP